ncbi:MAG TPA: hypothetical protein VFM29_09405 [Vicinamibacteria bacterium]|nr:hypothetical protein [Vicinamibacteria bacterium]
MDLPPDSPTALRRYTCQLKREHGKEICLTGCAARSHGVFEYVRVEAPGDLPPAEPEAVDVAVLDMNHMWPNLGHDSLVHAVQDAACDLIPVLEPAGLRVRVLSFEVRKRLMLPEGPGGRFALYVGTGGPGHLDPRANDGAGPGSQGIREDPAWEEPLFALFDAILESPDAALVAVCHSFGVMCRWSGVARPVLRSQEKGGKSAGVLENFLTPEALGHPWFGRLAREMPDRRRIRVVDHRLFDLVPDETSLARVTPIGYETYGIDGPPGEALTMVEWARDRAGIMPRVFAVNHHPEIVDRTRQVLVLREKLARGEVSDAWAEERERIMTATYPDDARDHRLHLTSDYTLMGPMRFHLARALRRRSESLGRPMRLHEDAIPAAVPALAG